MRKTDGLARVLPGLALLSLLAACVGAPNYSSQESSLLPKSTAAVPIATDATAAPVVQAAASAAVPMAADATPAIKPEVQATDATPTIKPEVQATDATPKKKCRLWPGRHMGSHTIGCLAEW